MQTEIILSHRTTPIVVGQWDTRQNSRYSHHKISGTIDLKTLANNVLFRDKGRDKYGATGYSTVPDHQSAVGQLSDWQERFEERAAIMEFDGGMSREEAEVHARITLNVS